MPSGWQAEIDSLPSASAVKARAASPFVASDVDYRALVAAVEAMGPEEFAGLDLDRLAAKYAK